MKSKAIFFVIVTSLFLLMYTALAQFDVSVRLVYSLFLIGNILVITMVYKVLKENYSTNKNFNHWYQDNPREE